ncbi:FlgB family protein [Yoonia sp. MH D7]
MYQNINIFQTSVSMAKHAGARQAVIASNIANADTPGYRARTIENFATTYNGGLETGVKATRAGHLAQDTNAATQRAITYSTAEPAPNGNSVSIEEELLNAVSVSREHDRALAIYRHGLNVIRTALGR